LKKLIILAITPFLFASSVNVDNLSKKIDILNNDKKISSKLDYKIYDPFASAKPIINEAKEIKDIEPIVILPIIVQTILNKKVLINGLWHKTGDIVQGNLIKEIHQKYIVVFKDKKRSFITIKPKKSILITKETIQ